MLIFDAVWGCPPVAESGAALLGCSGCSWRRLSCYDSGLWSVGSVSVVAWLLCSRWDLPGSEVEPVCLFALAGRFFTTEPPGKPLFCPAIIFILFFIHPRGKNSLKWILIHPWQLVSYGWLVWLFLFRGPSPPFLRPGIGSHSAGLDSSVACLPACLSGELSLRVQLY